jgi:VCBS repeat-containing protein
VVATPSPATLNFFVPNSSGQYSYNVDSSAFDKLPKGTTATYQFTIWGNGATPFSFFTTGTF